MQFIYCKDSGSNPLSLNTKEYSHLFKVRRVKSGKTLFFRNLNDDIIYSYKLVSIGKKEAVLELVESRVLKIGPKKSLHVGWCIVDPKTIEKILPFLNELGVSMLSLVYCEFSQKNFKIDMDRLKRILINSSQQCGRSSLMKIEILKDMGEFLSLYPQSKIIDFSEDKIKKGDVFNSFLVGCEGGFSQDERALMDRKNVVGIDNSMVLRSETAVLYVSILNS